MQAPQRKPPVGVVFDTSLDEVDQILALALLFGADGKRLIRLPSVSTSRFSLEAAAYLDVVARFFAGEQPGDAAMRSPLSIGMSSSGRESPVPPLVSSVLDQKSVDGNPVYRRAIGGLNDTADPVALMRNALSAQEDRNGAVVLAGLPGNLAALIVLPDGREWVARKARVLAIAGGHFDTGAADPLIRQDVVGFRALLASWPAPIVMAGTELNDALPFPGSSLDTSFAWARHHPITDAYRAFKPMPYDGPSRALAAALHVVSPDEGYFDLSEPGTITILDDGRTRFAPSPQGRHRYLIAKPAEKARVLDAYVQTTSAQPQRGGRRGGGAAALGTRDSGFGARDSGLGARDSGFGLPAVAQSAKAGIRSSATIAAAVSATLAAALIVAGSPVRVSGQAPDEFDTAVRPILTGTCASCHNARLASGGLDVSTLTSAESVAQQRDTWERILRRVRAGEMPPRTVPSPPADRLAAMTGYVQRAFERIDASAPPDPGRMTAHRLNRDEYANTIRDLLGVQFRADKYFPADDTADGLDTIGDVLTVSPLLMERYMAAAERIATWAISTEIPAKPVEAAYLSRERRIRRVDASTIEVEHRIDFDGDYVVRFALPGERPKTAAGDAAPVTLGFWMNGRLLGSKPVETKPSGLVYFDPYSEEELRLHLTEGDYVFRAGFIGDPFVKTLARADLYDRKKNKFLDSIVFVGPFRSATEKATRARLLTCPPDSGRACVERIVGGLARRAYRRPVTGAEVAALMRFVDLAKSQGRSAEQGLQLAIQAMLVSPNFLFRIERDPDPRNPRLVHEVSPFELASRLSYFLWSSMPDDTLLSLAESGRLRDSKVLAEQADRMLSDPRASAFAVNFAGQWLETRNLDIVKPDPDTFRDFDPDLREAMKAETALFFGYVLTENRPLAEFLTAPYTFLNERLARHYGIDGVTGPEFRRVELTTDRRGGVLSQAAVLTVSSYPTRTSPVIRGKYVLQNILGTPPTPPPPDVPPLDASAVGGERSMRDELERHRTDPTCASCHRNMDPLGFALENYDAIGRWRDRDGRFPVDPSGTLPDGRPFSSAGEMRALLVAQLPQFSRTLSERMLTYALHRGLRPYDRRAVDGIAQAVAADGYRFRTMVHQIVQSLPFRSRRGEGEPETR